MLGYLSGTDIILAHAEYMTFLHTSTHCIYTHVRVSVGTVAWGDRYGTLPGVKGAVHELVTEE